MIEHFRMLAGFNRWANGWIYDVVATLPEPAYRATPCAFFGSIHGTLNHLLVVDRLWFGRLEGERIVTLLAGLEEEDLAKDCYFTLISKPGEKSMKSSLILATVFNHHPHHRGQVHAMLKEAGAEPPALDLINYPAALG